MSKVIVLEETLDMLPFCEAMDWSRFQVFCADLLQLIYPTKESREYLSGGAKQEGIDIYVVSGGASDYHVVQCKRWQEMNPSAIGTAIDVFLAGEFSDKTRCFVLCTSADLSKVTHEIAIESARLRLGEKNVEFKVWDSQGLARELRLRGEADAVRLVYHYFGEQISKHFYGDIWHDFIRSIRKVEKVAYDFPEDYIERTISSNQGRYEIYQNTPYWLAEKGAKVSVLNLVENRDPGKSLKLLLLGIAGYGKTHEIDSIAANYSHESKILYPIKLSLRYYNGRDIGSVLDASSQDWKAIRDEDVLLLLDGLDEVSVNLYSEFVRELNLFLQLRPKINVVVSCRYNAYDVKSEPLQGFGVYVLNPLSSDDITLFINCKLGDDLADFNDTIEAKGMVEFKQHPFYLARMVRLFAADRKNFPSNKSELFDKILFERLEKDGSTYELTTLREHLTPIIERVAFCMTLTGKSDFSIKELKEVVSDESDRNLLIKYSVILKEESGAGIRFRFEHKNLQEYMCALCLAKKTFDEVKRLISIQGISNKLASHLVNTTAFLFENLDKSSENFFGLEDWLSNNDPEVLIRFERDRLSPQKRFSIFEKIYRVYKEKGLPIRTSSNFSLKELAYFIDFDNAFFGFLSKEMSNDNPLWMDIQIVKLFSYCPQPYLCETEIKESIFRFLEKDCPNEVHATCIDALYELNFTDEIVFQRVLSSKCDINSFEVRRNLIYLIKNQAYFQKYVRFILDSVDIFEDGQRMMSYGGSNMTLKKLIIDCARTSEVLKVFAFISDNVDVVAYHQEGRELHFGLDEMKQLFDIALSASKNEPRIIRLVYKIYRKSEIYRHYADHFALYKIFFEQTVGSELIFSKLYKHAKGDKNYLSFAGRSSCDFLLTEFNGGRITLQEMKTIRNSLSWTDQDIFRYIHDQLIGISSKDFALDDIGVDYLEVRQKQLEKNQMMLLNKGLFLGEVEQFFSCFQSQVVTEKELWRHDGRAYSFFGESIVFDAVRKFMVKAKRKKVSKNDFLTEHISAHDWEGYVLDIIRKLSKEKGTTLNEELRTFAEKWCKIQIENLEFDGSIVDIDLNKWQYVPIVEYVKEMYLLLEMQIEDELLLRMLLADWETFHFGDNNKQKTIGIWVIDRIENKTLLKEKLIATVNRRDVATYVLATHYKLCAKLGIRECKASLYAMISSNKIITDDQKKQLAEYYIKLGGKFEDFRRYLECPRPDKGETKFYPWHWFLLENLRDIERVRVEAILLQIMQSEDYGPLSREHACEQLIQLRNPRALEYWARNVMQGQDPLFESRWEYYVQFIAEMPTTQTTDILLELYEFLYRNELYNPKNRPYTTGDMVYSALMSLSTLSSENYKKIKDKLDEMVVILSGRETEFSIRFWSERLSQNYYQKLAPTITLDESLKWYYGEPLSV